MDILPEVAAALQAGQPVVALFRLSLRAGSSRSTSIRVIPRRIGFMPLEVQAPLLWLLVRLMWTG